MIQIRENINDVAEFNLLYDSVGWGAYDKKITKNFSAIKLKSGRFFADFVRK